MDLKGPDGRTAELPEESLPELGEIEYSKGNFFSAVYIAEVFSVLGEKDQVFSWPERAFREHDLLLVSDLTNHFRFEPVRSDLRYADLLRRMGLKK